MQFRVGHLLTLCALWRSVLLPGASSGARCVGCVTMRVACERPLLRVVNYVTFHQISVNVPVSCAASYIRNHEQLLVAVTYLYSIYAYWRKLSVCVCFTHRFAIVVVTGCSYWLQFCVGNCHLSDKNATKSSLRLALQERRGRQVVLNLPQFNCTGIFSSSIA
jgi:hypothetical protein